MKEYFGLEATLKSVKAIDGVEYLGDIPKRQPYLRPGERLLVVHNQLMGGQVDDATSIEWYEAAVKNAGSACVWRSYLIKLPGSSIDEVLMAFAQNQKITFNLPDKTVIRPKWN